MIEIKTIIHEKIKEISAQNKLKEKKIFVFGHNIYTEHINNFLYEEGYNLSGVIDNDKEKQGRKFCNTTIISPEKIDWERKTIVLIASKHVESMRAQLLSLSEEVEIYILFDFSKVERRNEFWHEENYEMEIREICQGATTYEKLKQNESLVIFPPSALGDVFIGCLSFQDYTNKVKSKSLKVVVSSKGAYKVTQLFKIKNVAMISEQEMDALVKFVFFVGAAGEDIICSWGEAFWLMSIYQKVPFAQYCLKYFFKLDNYCMRFPSIWDDDVKEKLENMGLMRGKTVVLAPYANSMEELPIQFWEMLTERLQEMKYCVVTNIVGDQKPIKGSLGMQIPLTQIGSYLEFAGYFVALRSGLCDVAGRSECKQIIIFRDRKCGFQTSFIESYDMHEENISANAIQCLYDDGNLLGNIDMIINFLTDVC